MIREPETKFWRTKPFKWAIVILAIVFGTLYLTSDSKAASLQETLDATYKLYTEDRPICSGQFIKSDETGDLFLTAAHCVTDENGSFNYEGNFNVRKSIYNSEYNSVSEETWFLDKVKVFPELDVALLTTRQPVGTFPTVDLATQRDADSLFVGQEMYAVGYPKVLELTITDGMFGGEVPSLFQEMSHPWYKTTIPITGGNSGGGLYIRKGEEFFLIGTALATWNDVSFMSYFTPYENIVKVIDG